MCRGFNANEQEQYVGGRGEAVVWLGRGFNGINFMLRNQYLSQFRLQEFRVPDLPTNTASFP